MSQDIYKEQIIDHYKQPRNFKKINVGEGVEAVNASCGDKYRVRLKVGAGGEIRELSFDGVGCAVSMASFSLLTERILKEKFKAREVAAMSDEDIVKMLGIEITPTRIKCATLPLRALKKALAEGGYKYETEKAAKIFKEGGVVIFPTDTVWGVGCRVGDSKAIERLYRIKRRKVGKPMAVLVSDVHMANRYGVMDKRAWRLAEEYWPGALTLVVKAKGNKLPKEIRGKGGSTVGLRAPNHQELLGVIKELNEGIAASSANFAGEKPVERREDLNEELVNLADAVMRGKSGGRRPSRILDVSSEQEEVLRK